MTCQVPGCESGGGPRTIWAAFEPRETPGQFRATCNVARDPASFQRRCIGNGCLWCKHADTLWPLFATRLRLVER